MENQNLNNDNQNSASPQNNSQPNQESESQLPNQEPKNTNIPPVQPKPIEEPEDMLAGTDDVQDTPVPKLENNQPSIEPIVPPTKNEQPTPPLLHPEPVEGPPVDNTPIQSNLASESKPNKGWIWWIVTGIAILVLATAGAYFLGVWPFADRPNIISEEPVERFIPLLHRTSTLPTGELKITGNTITANINNLETSLTGQFVYKLVLTNDISDIELGSFVGTNIDGDLVDEDGNTVTLISNSVEGYNTVKVIMHDARNESKASTILQGAISQNTAELNFPYDFLNINAGAVLEEVTSGENLVEFTFDNLPNVADIGYIYEARLAEFDGPYVVNELSLGKFAGTGQKTIFTAITDQNLIKYNQLVISLEPDWDRDPAISQIKPFSGNI